MLRKVDSKAFAARLRERREELGLSQAALAARAGYGQQTIVYYESGNLKRPDRCATQLAEALGTTREWLLWREGPRSVGPARLTIPELVENYKAATADDQARVSEILKKTPVPRRKSG